MSLLNHLEVTRALSSGAIPVVDPQGRNAITSGLDQVLSLLGEDVREALLFHINVESGLDEKDFPLNPARLGEALAAILGSGARILENRLVKKLVSEPASNPVCNDFARSITEATNTRLSPVWGACGL